MKKRDQGRLARPGVAFLIFLLVLSALGAAAAETYAVVSGTDSLNLRSGPNSSSQWLGAYSTGSWVTVAGSQNNFYYVNTSDGKTGYMSKNYLDTTDQIAYGNVAIVNNQKATAFLNLRSHPSYSATVITILYNGVPLNILSEDNGWYRVQMGDTVGYIRSEYAYVNYQPIGMAVATIKTPNNTAVNMRAKPNANSSVRHQFSGDRYVSVLYEGNGWWYVCIDGYTGFISSDFLAEGLRAARDIAAQNEDSDSYAIVKNPVSTQKLNLRELPSTAAAIVAKLQNGYQLSVVVQGTEWCRVHADTLGAIGYVMTKYLKLHNLPASPKLSVIHPQGSFVNMRSSADMTSSVVAKIPSGSTAIIIAPGPDWTKIKYKNKTGYVMNYFTSLAGIN